MARPTASFLKVIGLLGIFTLAPASLYIMYTRTGGPGSPKEMGFQKNLRYALMAGGHALDLAPLTAWPWIKACALDSAVSAADVEAVVGFRYENYAQLHWLPRADHWTLLFIDSEREASWGLARPITPVRIPRKELANLALPAGAKGACIDHGQTIQISRGDAPVGVSPVTLEFQGEGP